jgi:putative transposase
MKTVCRVLGVARSHVHDRHHRGEDWRDARRGPTPAGDAQLLAEIRQQIADLPSYGYRRACALVNRQRSAQGSPRVNPKRAYRVMAQAGLLLPKTPRRRPSSRKHEGTVTVGRAWEGKGLPGEPVREMLIEAVEKRFGSVEALPTDHRLEFLSDNGSAYIAADTRALARSLGLTPINTPVCSPQSNGMAESFVRTFKRDYVARMDLSDAATVLAQLPAAFEHFNEVHPHSSLKMRSPREFRRHQAAQARRSTVQEAVLHCE